MSAMSCSGIEEFVELIVYSSCHENQHSAVLTILKLIGALTIMSEIYFRIVYLMDYIFIRRLSSIIAEYRIR